MTNEKNESNDNICKLCGTQRCFRTEKDIERCKNNDNYNFDINDINKKTLKKILKKFKKMIKKFNK